MKRTTLSTIADLLTQVEIANKDEILAEVMKELNRNDAAKAEKDAGYEAAWDIVRGVFTLTTAPLTVAEIFEQVEETLPDGFTKGKVQYGLTHQWADRVVKIEGKPNTYRLA